MPKYIKLFSVFFMFFSVMPAIAQTSGIWGNYTNKEKINDAVATNKGIWCATDGGVFLYNYASSSFTVFNKADGLNGEAVTAIAQDKYNKLWFGSSNGTIDVYDPASNSFNRILDINSSDKILKSIYSITTSGDTIIVTSDFGISLINASNYSFYDTFSKFGDLSSNIKVSSAIKAGYIFACVNGGVAKQRKIGGNLSSSDAWDVFTTSDGLPSNNTHKVVLYRDTIIVSTDNGLSYFDNNTWKTFIPSFTGTNGNSISITDIEVKNDSLFVMFWNNVYLYKDGAWTLLYNQPAATMNKLIPISDQVIYATSDHGLMGLAGVDQGKVTIHPDGPGTNFANEIKVDANKNLWVASGSSSYAKGFYKYDGKKWKNYNLDNYPKLLTNLYYNVFPASDGTVYIGSWGGGFVRIKNDTNITVFNSSNTPLVGMGTYIVVAALRTDSKNNLWMLNYNNTVNNKILSALTKDSVWYHFKAADQYVGLYTSMVIDQYDTKWFASTNSSSTHGLYYFNENGALDNSNSVQGFIDKSTSSDLVSNIILCMALDKRGDIWVGTSLGAEIVSNTGQVLSGYAPTVQSVYTLSQHSINCIAVDPTNQKWIGTNEGLILVSSDGSTLISTYTTLNSSLLSNIISSITIDESDGTVYVETQNGLTSLKTAFAKPQDSFTNLFIYPNPFVIDGSDKKITIDGLVLSSSIKILSISGKLINQFASPGGRIAYWNGKTSDGNFVNSGIYIIVAYDQDGNNVATAKVAVIRKK